MTINTALALSFAADRRCLALAAARPRRRQRPANEQVVVPQVDRRDVRVPRYPSNDFEIGAFVGTYATENFGTSLVYGVRLGYHVTEDFFVQGVYAQTKVSDEAFRQILPGGVFATKREAQLLQPLGRLQHPAGRGVHRSRAGPGRRSST